MSLTIFHCCWLSLTVSSTPMELLAVSHCLPLLLAVSPGHMDLLHVSHCQRLLLDVSHRLYQCNGVAACLSLSPVVTGSPLLSLQVLWSC